MSPLLVGVGRLLRYHWNRHVQKLPWEKDVLTKVLFVWSHIPWVAESDLL